MSHRHLIAILTAILRAQTPELEVDAAVMEAIAILLGGMGEHEAIDAIDTITGGRPPAPEILHDVDITLAMRGASGKRKP